MKTTRILPRPRWPEPLGPRFPRLKALDARPQPGPPAMPALPPEAGHDFLVLNPRPELLEPDPPPAFLEPGPPPPDLTFYNIDFP